MTEFERCLYIGRKKKKLSQVGLAEITGLDRTDIINLESGRFVLLDEETVCRIAAIVDMENGMFLSMYRAAFQQELRKARSGPSNGNAAAQAESGTQAEPALAEASSQESALSPDLLDLGRTIMSMPTEVKENLVSTIRMLIQTVSIRAA